MRFKFCGEGDCPDWILVEIHSLSRISSVKMKLLCQLVAEAAVEGEPINYEKVKKLTSDAKLDDDETKACVSALSFILLSAARHGTNDATLINELQQIGFPREHAQALCRIYSERLSSLTSHLQSISLRTSRLIKVEAQPHNKHYDLQIRHWNIEKNGEETVSFTATPLQMLMLINELKKTREKLTSVEHDL
uniref:COMM domain-containing protein n=1 Tax=Clastoptera arizonana TaxID=38151 RepID=A0A1B6DTJ0_9HEMI